MEIHVITYRARPVSQKKKQVGRPKLPDEMRKVNFSVSVTPELREAIDALARDDGMSASQWACAALTKCAAKDMVFAPPSEEESLTAAIAGTQSVLRTLTAMRNGEVD